MARGVKIQKDPWVWPEMGCRAPLEELGDFVFGSKFVSLFPISFSLDKHGLQRNKKGADVSVNIYIYTHAHKHTHTRIYTYLFYIHTYIRTYIHTHVYG